MIRTMTLADVDEVTELYWLMLQEDKRTSHVAYPRVVPSIRRDIRELLVNSLKMPQWHAEVMEVDEKIIGFASGTLVHRPFSEPSSAFRLDLIYILPEYRRGRRALQLISTMWEWGFHALASFVPEPKERTIEGAWTPGSLAEKLWTSAGCTPYMVLCSWTGPDGFPHPNVKRLLTVKE